MNSYIRYKREKRGSCNICKTDADLTWDHVPPQGSIDLMPMEMESLLGRIDANQHKTRPVISQNGVKYRTICSTCNNTIGHRFDPVLNQFSTDVGQFLKSQLHFPEIVHIKSSPTAIIRAIVGHLLAASTHPDSGLGSKGLHSFIFDETTPVPDDISVFYWLYPYTSIAVVRDILMPAVRGSFNKVGSFDMIKFFPVAYLVSDLQTYQSLPELTVFRKLKATDEVDVPIIFNSVKESRWPDIVDDGNIIFGGAPTESSIYARPKSSVL
jgi:hypothetical protein